MPNFFQAIMTLIIFMFIVFPSMAAGNSDTKVTIIDLGIGPEGEGDGARGYRVFCSQDGRKAMVRHHFEENKVCIYSKLNSEEICFNNNDVNAAAIKTCEQ